MNVITAYNSNNTITIKVVDFNDAIHSNPYLILLSQTQVKKVKRMNMFDTTIMTSFPDKFMKQICNAAYEIKDSER